MSFYTRLASTNVQEESVAAVEKAFRKANIPIGGYTTIGKSPKTVILDIKWQDSKIRINAVGEITIGNETDYDPSNIEAMSQAILIIHLNPREA